MGVLTAIAHGHKQMDIEVFLPWNFGSDVTLTKEYYEDIFLDP